MTEDQAKAPRAKPAPAMPLIDRQIADANARAAYAQSEDLRRYYVERLVGLRFERGDFPMIQCLDKPTRAGLVRAMLKETSTN